MRLVLIDKPEDAQFEVWEAHLREASRQDPLYEPSPQDWVPRLKRKKKKLAGKLVLLELPHKNKLSFSNLAFNRPAQSITLLVLDIPSLSKDKEILKRADVWRMA